MRAAILEAQTSMLRLEEEATSGVDGTYVYEHLKYYCSKLDHLPAVVAELREDGLWVTRGAVYLQVARELGRPLIRTLVEIPSSDVTLQDMASRGEISFLEWSTILAENAPGIKLEWHVFFFCRQLSVEERVAFERLVTDLFSRVDGCGIGGIVRFSFEKAASEFVAQTPIGNERWYRDLLVGLRVFHDEFCPIESYQGMRFGSP